MKPKQQRKSEAAATVSDRLQKAIVELRQLHKLLMSGENIDPRILTDFRDSINRIRNTAWSAQQYLAQKTTGEDPSNLLSILSSERVRVAYQVSRALQEDLKSSDVKFQTGQLVELYSATKALTEQLRDVLGDVGAKPSTDA